VTLVVEEPSPGWLEVWVAERLPEHPLWAMGLSLAGVLAAAVLAYLLARYLLLQLAARVIRQSRTGWDDAIVARRVLHKLVPIVPTLVLYHGFAVVPGLGDHFRLLLQRVAMATILVLAARSASALLTVVNDIYRRYPIARGRPIKGYLQVVKILLFIATGIMVVSLLLNREPWILLGGLGAMTAVLLLIFRDTILSLVAGVQLTGNDLIRVGDWIEMPQFDADGDVEDIALNVVKVRNWDKTVTVIPAHKFLEHSFRNWRGMFETGGRRIKRSVFIDMNTIRFLTEEEIRRFGRFVLLRDYMQQKAEEIGLHNREQIPAGAADILANRRHLTNIGTLRAYVVAYLRRHAKIHQEMTLLVRQLQPTSAGLPLEIYAFTSDTAWSAYEGIQADLFDHILAILPEFGLRVFQEPAGTDLRSLAGAGPAEQRPPA